MQKLTFTMILLVFVISSAWTQEGKLKNRNGVTIGKTDSYIPGITYSEFQTPKRDNHSFTESFLKSAKSESSVLLEEYFDVWPPEGWSMYFLGNAGTWMQDVGEGTALHTWEDGINKNWLISPQLNIENDSYKLSLRNWSNGLTDQSCQIAISTGSGNPEDGDFIDILSPANSGWYYDIEIFFNEYAGENIYIAFHTTNLASWRVDDIIVAPNTFVDASVEAIVNPKGSSEEGAVEDVLVKVGNLGTSTLGSFEINWSVNGEEQATFSIDNANIFPDSVMIFNIGEYDFSNQGLYSIETELVTENDANLENNTLIGEYSVGYAYDLILKEISPSASYPQAGIRSIYFTVLNKGKDIIDNAEATVLINGEEALNVTLSSLDIQPGQLKQLYIGEFDFESGLNEITGIIDVDFDLSLVNNTLEENYSVGEIYEAFQQPVFPPTSWKTTWAELDWWFPQFNDSSNTYVQMQGYADSDYNRKDTLWTPLLQIESDDVLNWRGFFPGVFDIGTLHIIAKDGASGQLSTIQNDVSQVPTVWTDYSVNIGSAAGEKYIGFVADSPAESYGIFRIDDVHITSNFALKQNDLTAVNFIADRLMFQNVETEVYCKIMNRGQNTVSGSSYSIEVKSDEQGVIASMAGVDINSFDERWITVNVDFSDVLSDEIYFEIVYSGDEFTADNQSKKREISIIPENTQQNTAGTGDMYTLYAPFNGWNINWYGEEDITQTVYYPSEIGTPGYIHGLIFYYNYCNEFGSEVPLKVWVGETQNDNLEDEWFPYNDLTLLYNEVIYIDHNVTGSGALYIPFDTPYYYSGTNNLVFQHYTSLPSFFYTNTNFLNQSSIGNYRTRSVIEEEVDFKNPPESCYVLEHYPVTTFVISPDEGNQGVISGIVYDENSNPISGAKVMVDGTGVAAETNEEGYYELQALVFDEYTLTAEKFGYDDLSLSVDLETTTYVQDFYMSLRPKITISGNIVGDNDETAPLSGVELILDGYDLYGGVSNDNGDFNIVSVYGNTYYDLTLKLYGYHDLTIDSLEVIDQDIDLGTLIMEEHMIPAHHILGEYTSQKVELEWEEPINSTPDYIINDIGYDQDGYANEPMENVWLGNRFDNPGTITLTDVDLRWTIDGGTPQDLTVDVFNEDGDLLATSQEFTTSFDSWLTLDLPNLTITGDYYIMVHWRNNPETSHFLGICWDWDFVMPNTAFIKFPNQDLQLLSLFWDPTGQNLPNYSFLVRPHIMEPMGKIDAKEVLSYNVFRGDSDDLLNIEDWEMLNSEPITSTSFVDGNVGSISGEVRYAVQAVYTNDNAEVTFTETILIPVGVEDVEENSFKMYPNPTQGFVNINSTYEIEKIEIFDVTGSLVLSRQENSQNIRLDIGELNVGVYLINIYSTKGISSEKLIVE